MKQSLTDIWEKVLAGDQEAWESLVFRYAALVNSVARRAGLSAGNAEDCAQQTWMALYVGRANVKDPERLPAWLIRVALRKAMRLVRRRIKEGNLSAAVDPVDMATLPDDELIRLEQSAQLTSALERLDERCRRVLSAIFLSPGQQSYNDIARALGMPPNSLGPTRSRCLNKLKKILTEMDSQ